MGGGGGRDQERKGGREGLLLGRMNGIWTRTILYSTCGNFIDCLALLLLPPLSYAT